MKRTLITFMGGQDEGSCVGALRGSLHDACNAHIVLSGDRGDLDQHARFVLYGEAEVITAAHMPKRRQVKFGSSFFVHFGIGLAGGDHFADREQVDGICNVADDRTRRGILPAPRPI